jgi:hypothetical protein
MHIVVEIILYEEMMEVLEQQRMGDELEVDLPENMILKNNIL